jgi:hypothetical protein
MPLSLISTLQCQAQLFAPCNSSRSRSGREGQYICWALEGRAEWLHANILQLRCGKSGDHFSNQRMGNMMFVGIGTPVTAKRTCDCRVEGRADYKEHEQCFCLRFTGRGTHSRTNGQGSNPASPRRWAGTRDWMSSLQVMPTLLVVLLLHV